DRVDQRRARRHVPPDRRSRRAPREGRAHRRRHRLREPSAGGRRRARCGHRDVHPRPAFAEERRHDGEPRRGQGGRVAVKPAYEDATLLIELYETRREEKLRAARAWFTSTFKVKTFEEWQKLCPPGSDANANYRMVTSYWEMVASFVTGGILNPELFYQNGRELLLVYERIRDILPQVRQAYANPLELKNLETVAHAFITWWNTAAPGAYDAFSKRIRG